MLEVRIQVGASSQPACFGSVTRAPATENSCLGSTLKSMAVSALCGLVQELC
jgi:hypothetical protein